MNNILRVNSITGKSYLIPINKIILIEESQNGDSSYIYLTENKEIQCTERIYELEEIIKRLIN